MKHKINMINEEYERIVLENGLTVQFATKPGFSKMMASVTTKFGSIHNAYVKNGKEYTLSNGIAHFLEHKVFEKEDKNFLNQFSKYGANVNAYTTFDHTSYFFNCTDNFMKNFELLLEMMTTPYFTEETVEKEKGIIAEEIKMYEDHPDARMFFGPLKTLYKYHSVNIDIAGTVESISQITANDLYECFNTFYHPSNLVITIVGNVTKNEVLECIEKYYGTYEKSGEYNVKTAEDIAVHKQDEEYFMDVASSKIALAFKRPTVEKSSYIREAAIDIYLEMVLGKSSDNFEALASESIYPGYLYSELDNVGFAIISADTEKVNKFYHFIETALNTDVNNEQFEIVKNKNIGKIIKSFNSIENIGRMLVDSFVSDITIEKMVEDLSNLTVEQVNEFAKQVFIKENSAKFKISQLSS